MEHDFGYATRIEEKGVYLMAKIPLKRFYLNDFGYPTRATDCGNS